MVGIGMHCLVVALVNSCFRCCLKTFYKAELGTRGSVWYGGFGSVLRSMPDAYDGVESVQRRLP